MYLLINSLIFSLAIFYSSSKVYNKRIKYNKMKFWLLLMLKSILFAMSYAITSHYIRVIFNFVLLFVINSCYYKRKISETILRNFFIFVLIVLSETIVASFIMFSFSKNSIYILESSELRFSINFAIAIILILLVNTSKIKRYLLSINENLKDNIASNTAFLIIFIVCLYSAFFYYLYYNVNLLVLMLLSIALISITLILVIKNLKTKIYSEHLEDEYNQVIINLNEYEKILENYRLTNHENINNLIVLKDMLKQDNKKVQKYIDYLINEKQEEDEDVLLKVSKLPTGGLQGLLYQKIIKMKEKEINYNLEISRTITNISHFKLDFELNKNICTIIGILIDNAIEAVEGLKDKSVMLYFYVENNEWFFSISNTFSGYIDLDKIDKVGYSSKGRDRGYGLSLVKSIIDCDKRISLERAVIKNIFKQTIKIKM